MAEKKKTKANAKKLHGRLPTKRSINLVLNEENKVRASSAIPAVIAVIVLAALFSKFLVIDRLNEMNRAQVRIDQLQDELESVDAALSRIGNVDKDYAHYTYDGMTRQEMDRVSRTDVLKLIVDIQPPEEEGPNDNDLNRLMRYLFRQKPVTDDSRIDEARDAARKELFDQLIPVPVYVIMNWNVSENLLTIEVSGQTLEKMNEIARLIERSPIVDSCTISTANKSDLTTLIYPVRARFVAYLKKLSEQPAQTEAEEATQP